MPQPNTNASRETSCRQSSEIPVDHFRQILIWPLLVVDNQGEFQLSSVTDILTSQGWKWTDRQRGDLASNLSELPWYGTKNDFDYSEIVYFHSYARDFLYGGDGGDVSDRPLRNFYRQDISAVRIQIDTKRSFDLTVERMETYLFETGVALLVVEMAKPIWSPTNPPASSPSPITLADILDLQNLLRMAFPRRWKSNGQPSESPLKVCWLDSTGNELTESAQDYSIKDDFTKIVRRQAELPAAKHLRHILKPFALYGDSIHERFTVKQIEDQRIPSMTYLSVKEPREITEWDFARIAFFDGSGESFVGSYSDSFLQDWARDCSYERFWQREPSSPADSASANGKAVAEHNQMMRTRWLCSGYGFSVVGATEDSFYTGQIAANFRHHYFRMGMMAHFHHASLLAFRDQLSEATKKTGIQFRDAVMQIQNKLTQFRARFWFTEVSTQLQGQEIFAWWSERLGNRQLFEQVTSDVAAAESQIRTQFEAEETKHVNQIAEIGGALAVVGFIAAVVSLAVSIWTANWSQSQSPILGTFISVVILLVLPFIIWGVLRALKK